MQGSRRDSGCLFLEKAEKICYDTTVKLQRSNTKRGEKLCVVL